MKRMKRLALMLGLAAALGLVCGSFAGCGGGGTNKTVLYFDGGGGSGNYTTTSSYDTLEQLAEEWNANNEKFEVVINKASLNGNRSAITSMLSAGTAPDMLMQVGTVVNDDIGTGWYADLTEYLEQPNPYEEGNTAWKDIYGTESIAASKASDGKNYYVCLDKIPVGMVYNMDLLAQAGIAEVPQTYSEFLACLEALQKAKDEGRITAEVFMHGGLWQESYLGTSVYGSKVEEWDEDDTGVVSAYELVKAYKEGKWTLDDEYFREFLRLCYEKAKYYPDNYLSYDTAYNFARGNLAVTDAVGNVMRTLTRNARFNVEIAGYPVLDTEASAMGGYTTVRGSAGLSSAYWVTNNTFFISLDRDWGNSLSMPSLSMKSGRKILSVSRVPPSFWAGASGYHCEGNDVVFMLLPSIYRDYDIQEGAEIYVAGTFNDWKPARRPEWKMEYRSYGGFSAWILQVPKSRFFDGGKILHPVREMVITGNMIHLWNRLRYAGSDARDCTRWQIPTICFDEVDFSG